MKNKAEKTILFIVLFLLGSCANQAPPPGGPEDRTPPQVFSTIPEANSLNVDLNTKIEILFSEKIDSRSIQNAIFISPNPGESVEIKSKGKKIILKFDKPLIDDVTYTITLGSGIKDLRRNGMKQSFTLAFSTGIKLDRNQIRGKVFYERPEEVTVWAYFLESEDINPSVQQPQYITQCGSDGSFRLYNIAPRKYRLFAVVDRIRNQTYQISQEFIGVTSSDIDLTADSLIVENKLFRLTKVDTSAIKILQVDQADRRHFRVRFSRPVFQSIETELVVELKDSTGRKNEIVDRSVDTESPEIWSFTTQQRDELKYTITFQNLFNQDNKMVDGSINFDFLSINKPDTSHPEIITVTPEDSSLHIPQDFPFLLTFSESIDTTGLNQFITIFQDSTECKNYSTSWKTLSQLRIKPDSLWNALCWYHCEIDTNQFRDFAKNPLRFEKYKYSWKILDPDTLSEISGRIFDQDSLASGLIFLELLKNGEEKAYREVTMQDTGLYKFANILPDQFIVQGFRDADKNGIFSFGNVLPFVPSERFFISQDTILVRSRWPNEGNDFRILK